MRDDSHEVDKQGLIEYLITIAVIRRECAWFTIPFFHEYFIAIGFDQHFSFGLNPQLKSSGNLFNHEWKQTG